jgi:hypothetical protein
MAGKEGKASTLTAEEASELHRIVVAFRKVAGNLDALASEIEKREASAGQKKVVRRQARQP